MINIFFNSLRKLQFLFVSQLSDHKAKILQKSQREVSELLELKGSCDKFNTYLNFFPYALYTDIEITNNTQIYKNYKTTKLPKNKNFVKKYQKLQKNNEQLI